MTIGELRKLLDDPDSPLLGLDGDTPILPKSNCAGYAPMRLGVESGWRYKDGSWVQFPYPERESIATAVLVVCRG